jgi:hypothetical protein
MVGEDNHGGGGPYVEQVVDYLIVRRGTIIISRFVGFKHSAHPSFGSLLREKSFVETYSIIGEGDVFRSDPKRLACKGTLERHGLACGRRRRSLNGKIEVGDAGSQHIIISPVVQSLKPLRSNHQNYPGMLKLACKSCEP